MIGSLAIGVNLARNSFSSDPPVLLGAFINISGELNSSSRVKRRSSLRRPLQAVEFTFTWVLRCTDTRSGTDEPVSEAASVQHTALGCDSLSNTSLVRSLSVAANGQCEPCVWSFLRKLQFLLETIRHQRHFSRRLFACKLVAKSKPSI